jgi:hypothetical protein
MPQPWGTEQAILFRKIGIWQEKFAELNRLNTAVEAGRGGHVAGKCPQVFDKIHRLWR